MHIFCALTIGIIFGDSGSNAKKVISNVGLFLVAVVYLWYTTIMPGVLRCKFKNVPIQRNIIKQVLSSSPRNRDHKERNV